LKARFLALNLLIQSLIIVSINYSLYFRLRAESSDAEGIVDQSTIIKLIVILILFVFILFTSNKSKSTKKLVREWYCVFPFVLVSAFIVPYAFGLPTFLILNFALVVQPIRFFIVSYKS